MVDEDAEYHDNYKANIARLKWLSDHGIEIGVIEGPHSGGCYRYYELRAPIPGKDPSVERWTSFGRQGEGLDSIVDRLMEQEQSR